MKTIYKTAIVAIIALMLNVKISVAQEPTTRESVRTQYTNNKVPGLKYGPSSKQKRSIQSVNSKQNTTGNIRDVIFTDGVPANKSQVSRTNRSISAKSSNTKLSSDQKASEPEKNKEETKNIVPSQGNVKEPEGTPQQTAPVKATSTKNGSKKTK